MGDSPAAAATAVAVGAGESGERWGKRGGEGGISSTMKLDPDTVL